MQRSTTQAANGCTRSSCGFRFNEVVVRGLSSKAFECTLSGDPLIRRYTCFGSSPAKYMKYNCDRYQPVAVSKQGSANDRRWPKVDCFKAYEVG